MSRPTAGIPPLDSFRPFRISANVRGAIQASRCFVAPGLGQAGDLILGAVKPRPGQTAAVLDQDATEHQISMSQRVLTVLGPRDSSTHVCATIPAGGVPICADTTLHWVAGESGIVGCLERQPPSTRVHNNELAVEFLCDGLVLNAQHRPINVRDFAVSPAAALAAKPIVLVAATSSEAGKTVLAGKLIRRLSERGIRVGAIKATGTGGVLDSLHHSQCGAASTLDFVDAGLITTHCTHNEFTRRIPLVFRAMETANVDLIVAELGGDLLSANNPVFFDIEELIDNTLLLLVLSNDALAAAGVNTINESHLRFPVSRIRHFTSPFRNHPGMARRMAAAGIVQCCDPRSDDDVRGLAAEILDNLALTPRRPRQVSTE